MDLSVVQAVFKQILVLTLLGVTGFFIAKKKILPDEAQNVLSRLIVKVTYPALIFTTMISKEFSPQDFRDGGLITLFSLIFLLISFGITTLTIRLTKLQRPSSDVMKVLSMIGNTVFLAFPLLSILSPDYGIAYGVFYNLGNDLLLWTLSIYILNGRTDGGLLHQLRPMYNINTLAFAFGILGIIIKLKELMHSNPVTSIVYDLGFEAFNKLGGTTIYISMIFIGMMLANVQIKSFTQLMKEKYHIFLLSFTKLICMPLLALFTLNLLGSLIPYMVKVIIVIMLAMPGAALIAALAKQYHSDDQYAAEIISVTSVISVVTLPLIVYMLIAFGQ